MSNRGDLLPYVKCLELARASLTNFPVIEDIERAADMLTHAELCLQLAEQLFDIDTGLMPRTYADAEEFMDGT